MERAVDELRARFGKDAITRGLVFGAIEERQAPALDPQASSNLKQWFDFETKAEERALREWCDLNSIEVGD